MSVHQDIKNEFVEIFKQRFPEISKVIDFEKNINGDIISNEIIKSHFILNIIKFWKKEKVQDEEFEEVLDIFRTCNFENNEESFELETMGLTFIIGDFDDTSAVEIVKDPNGTYAKIWFRWWVPGIDD